MRNKLFWKLGLTYIVLPFLVLLAADLYAARVLRRDYERVGFDHLASLMRLAAARIPPIHDTGALGEWAQWISRSGARVTIVAADGTVLADSAEAPRRMENHGNRPEIRTALESGQGRAVRYSGTVRRELLYLAQRLDSASPAGGRPPFILRLSTPLAEIDAALGDIRRRLLLASLVILLLAVGGALLLSRALTGRIHRLKEFSLRVAEGDFRPLLVEREGDELAELGRALNETAARLDRTIRTLTEERNRSAAILRSMVEGVAVIGPDERIVFLNRAFAEALGVDWSAFEGRSMGEVVRQPDLLEVTREVLRGTQSSVREITLGPRRTESAARHFAATAAAARTAAADSFGAVLVLHDITELRRLERVRRDFVANVSHELKTPLTAIQGFAETLLGGALDDATNRRRFLEIIRQHAARLGRLTDDLLRLSEIEAGKLHLDLRPVSVVDVVESCVETARVRAAQKGIAITTECPPDLPRVRADARRLAEVLQNLLDNAVTYTPESGRIVVRTSAVDARLRIAVSDTGIGIPAADQQRIFERFYRVDAARSREAGGTGLGLSIARHLVEAHGGRIEVESEVGRGSTFTIVLNLER